MCKEFLVPCCYALPAKRLQSIVPVLPTVHAELFMHADFCIPGSTLNVNVNFIRLFDCIKLYKLQQMLGSRWVSGLCTDPLGSPREGREERRIDRGREVASCLDPQN